VSQPLLKVSFILPVLNEAHLIVNQLQRLQCYRDSGHEIIVVDGGSYDGTPGLATPLADLMLQTGPGRSLQMNAGANYANGNLLLFLHADTCLPGKVDKLLEQRIAQAKSPWGWFDIRLSNTAFVYRLIGRAMTLRSRLTGVCTGDQALFVDTELWGRVGGFAAVPLMEDVEISKRLRRHAKPLCISEQAVTSSRRWQDKGVFRTIFLMWWLRLLYFLGVNPDYLVKQYYPQGIKPNAAVEYQYPGARVLVFAREPRLGAVKTRLQGVIGKERALALHEAMIARVTATVTQSQLAPMALWVSSNKHHKLFLSICNIKDIFEQSGEDLGQKMAHAVATTLSDNSTNTVLLIGADCPSIDHSYLASALDKLAEEDLDAVVGPAEDGGYVLMGLKAPAPELFRGIEWGADTVLRVTLQRLQDNGLRYHLLDQRWDVDRAEDLDRLAGLVPPLSF
jgi:rSAM/selenodomain-associated transferase 2/rSAM/selenodomain-associated transferase 1